MPINYQSESKTFVISNKNISYSFLINSQGLLQHIYFGKNIGSFDYSSLIDLGWDWTKTYLDKDDIEKINNDYYNDRSLMELSPHGCNDKRGAPIVIRYSDGTRQTNFKYVSHRIYSGKPILTNLPSSYGAQKDVTSLEIVMIDDEKKVKCLLTYSIFERLDIITRNMTLSPIEDSGIKVLRAYSMELDLPNSNYDLIHFCGDWCQERYFDRTVLHDGTIDISSNYGRSSHEENPYFILADHDASETSGIAIGFGLVYSGNFSFKVNVSKWKTTRVLFGINDEDFEWNLSADLICPEVVMSLSLNGFEGLTHNFHDFVRNNLIRYKNKDVKRPLLFNSWEGCYLEFNTQTIIDYIDSAKTIGAELFVLDDGWFGSRNTDDRSLGDWYINENKINLQKVIDHCHQKGLKFGLWFEPEMINPLSDLYKKYDNFALGSKKTIRSLSRHQLVLDTSIDEIVDNIFYQMCEILDKYDIDYVKWDHNRSIGEHISSRTNYGEVYHRIILGTYRLIDQLNKRYPSILFEGCASGGGRFDLGMLCYFPQIWTSDETDPIQRLFIQYGTSFAYPLQTMGAHISKNKMTDYLTKGAIALFGTYGLEMNPCKLNSRERKQIKEINKIYHRYHQTVISEGDFYRLLSPFETNYCSFMSISKNKRKVLVMFINILKENNRYRFLKLRGLNPHKNYRLKNDGKEYSGAYLMEIGINLTRWLEEFTCLLFILEEVHKVGGRE